MKKTTDNALNQTIHRTNTAEINHRLDFAKSAIMPAGKLALDYFHKLDSLNIEKKGPQDLVSEADKNVEHVLRRTIAESFPEDGMVGEEHGRLDGTSGYVWFIDPIDGTGSFLSSIPDWVVVLACVHQNNIVAGIIYNPVYNELYWATANGGAWLNGRKLSLPKTGTLKDGWVGVSYSHRRPVNEIGQFISDLTQKGGLFFRNGSAALMLSYVAGGRLLGYCEAHLNPWDCLAGLLLVKEAGAGTEQIDMNQMTTQGGRVVVGQPGVFPDLVALADKYFV